MAKRRKIEAPSVEDLSRIEEEFRRETPLRGGAHAPIAQVAAESAGLHDPRSPEDRAVQARDRSDATRLREAEGRGLLIAEIPVEDIAADALVRDRVVLDAEELRELRHSIEGQGLRLPIEVFALPKPGEGPRYGLLSGYRRLKVYQILKAETGHEKFDRIKAIVRDPDTMGGTFAAMVEENEIRASLSHYERGRIAAIAAQQGAFANLEAAVAALFPAASKAKRSKIRSFAAIFEELGDLLSFPELLREKDGLALSAALRDGHEERLRDMLADVVVDSPQEELAAIERALKALEPPKRDRARGGRPARQAAVHAERRLESGVSLRAEHDGRGWLIRVDGRRVDGPLMDDLVGELARLLGPA